MCERDEFAQMRRDSRDKKTPSNQQVHDTELERENLDLAEKAQEGVILL